MVKFKYLTWKTTQIQWGDYKYCPYKYMPISRGQILIPFWPCLKSNVLVREALCSQIHRRGGFLQGMSCVQTAGEMSAACSSSHAIHAWIYEHVKSSWNHAGQVEGPAWVDWGVLTTYWCTDAPENNRTDENPQQPPRHNCRTQNKTQLWITISEYATDVREEERTEDKPRSLKWPSVRTQCFLKCRHLSLCCRNELSSGIELLLEAVWNEVHNSWSAQWVLMAHVSHRCNR